MKFEDFDDRNPLVCKVTGLKLKEARPGDVDKLGNDQIADSLRRKPSNNIACPLFGIYFRQISGINRNKSIGMLTI